MSKLCPCPGRKCRSLATPYVIKKATEMLVNGASASEIADWVRQRVAWREQQPEEFTKGVKPENVEAFLTDLKSAEKKGRGPVVNMLENYADAMHEKIKKNQALKEQQEFEDSLNDLDSPDDWVDMDHW